MRRCAAISCVFSANLRTQGGENELFETVCGTVPAQNRHGRGALTHGVLGISKVTRKKWTEEKVEISAEKRRERRGFNRKWREG